MLSFAPFSLKRIASVAWAVALFCAAAPGPAAADRPWLRTSSEVFAPGTCSELHIRQFGERAFEVRFSPQPIPEVGKDVKVRGASLFFPTEPGQATAVFYHTGGAYRRTFRVEDRVAWSRDGRRLCFYSGDTTVCGTSFLEPTHFSTTAFGRGWKTGIAGCGRRLPVDRSTDLLAVGGAALLGLAFWTFRRRASPAELRWIAALVPAALYAAAARIDPWWFNPAWSLVLVPLPLQLLLLRRFRHSWSDAARLPFALLAFAVAGWGAIVPSPIDVITNDAAIGVAGEKVPLLWIEQGYWSADAPVQSLWFRQTSVHSVLSDRRPIWILLGGSVAHGGDVELQESFAYVAERKLAERGIEIQLLNGAVPGWNLEQLDRLMIDLGDELPVQGIVIMSILNNAAFPLRRAPPKWCDLTLAGGQLCNSIRSPLRSIPLKFLAPKPFNPERYRRTLTRLLERETALGRSMILLDETSRSVIEGGGGPFAETRPPRYREIQREVAAAVGIRVHEVADAVRGADEAERFHDNIHLARGGHAAVGSLLADLIQRQIEHEGLPSKRDLR